ncbi:MAG: hypothetical protein K2H06_02430, partial [Anaeroplasmataceae bacterium]|nr:hypothetical protein [Anaeroplasmataceae bacterium]
MKIKNDIKSYSNYKKDEDRVKEQIHFEKYEKKRKNSFRLQFILVPVMICILLIGIGVGIATRKPSDIVDKNYSIEYRKELSKVVYNSAIANDESYEPYPIDFKKLEMKNSNNVTGYSDLKIYESFLFQVEMNCSLEPYFSIDVTGKTLDIVVAKISLFCVGKHYNNWYDNEMIILIYEREIIGFLAPSGNYIEDVYDFSSAHFLTEDSIVKYYEPEDTIYDFRVDAKDKANITLSIEETKFLGRVETSSSSTIPSTTIDHGSVNMLKESYKALNNEYTLSLIEQSMVKEIETSAIIVSLGDGIIYVTSQKNPTLASISLFCNAKIYKNGIAVEQDEIELKVGDRVEFSYYQRYQEYQPIDILSLIDISEPTRQAEIGY